MATLAILTQAGNLSMRLFENVDKFNDGFEPTRAVLIRSISTTVGALILALFNNIYMCKLKQYLQLLKSVEKKGLVV